jgi:outer membrane protein W
MKKITMFVGLMLIAAVAVNAQEYKKFRVGTGLGYAIPGGSGAGGGISWTLEPGYRVNDQILANFRYEAAAIIRGTVDETSASFDVAGIGSYTVNGQYYLMSGGFRPYVGVGLGMFSIAAASVDGGSNGGGVSETAGTKFGFYPRIGFDAGHFTLNLDYNIVGNTKAIVTTGTGNTTTEFKNSYIGIRVGGYFGGGRK